MGFANAEHTMDSTAHNNYKSKDALARASNQHKLPISWHLRDVPDIMIGWHLRNVPDAVINDKSPLPDSQFGLTTSQRPTTSTRPTPNQSSLPSSTCWCNATSLMGNLLAANVVERTQGS